MRVCVDSQVIQQLFVTVTGFSGLSRKNVYEQDGAVLFVLFCENVGITEYDKKLRRFKQELGARFLKLKLLL